MKKIKIKKEEPELSGERENEIVKNVMNLSAAMNVIYWPDDLLMALAYCGYLRTDMSCDYIMFDGDQIMELTAKIEQAEDERNRRANLDNLTEARSTAYIYNNPPTL